MLNKELHIKLKVWHILAMGIIVFLVWTNYVQRLTTNKLESEKTELVRKNKSNNDKIDSLKSKIKEFDAELAIKDTLIAESERKERQWRYSYYKLKSQAENENKHPIHVGTNDRVNYLLAKYGDTK